MIDYPILVVSYVDDIRAALVSNLERAAVAGIPCASFCEAEDIARDGVYSGILVDLQSIIKAKGDEKLVACSLTGFYPTLRVRALGGMLVPMAMPGDAKQDSSLKDFLEKSCRAFTPRRLRLHRRRDSVHSALVGDPESDSRVTVMNISWGGLFLMDLQAERRSVGETIRIRLREFDVEIDGEVRWVRPWGERKIPGAGVAFRGMGEGLDKLLFALIQRDRHNDRDRMIAR